MNIGRSLFSFDTDEDFRGCFDDDDPIGGINFSWRLAVVWVVVWVAVGKCSSSSLACVRFDGCLPSFPFKGHGNQDRVFLEEQITWRDGIVSIAHIVLPQIQFKAIHERSKKGRKRKQKNNKGKGPQATVAVDLNSATTAVGQSVVVGEVVSIESNVLRVAFADDAGREYGFINLFRIASSNRPVRDSLPSLATSGSA